MKRSIRFCALALSLSLLLMTLSIFGAAQKLKMGDVNGDGKVTTSDAREALRMSVGLGSYTADQQLVADVTGDNIVKSRDARLILQVAIHIYDESYFYDKFYTEPPPPLTGTTEQPTRDVNWDDILGTSEGETSRTPTTTQKPTHPNNQFTKPTEEPGTLPDTTFPDTTNGTGEEPGTVPASTVPATSIIHTGTPSRPSTEPTVSRPTTSVPVTEDPNAPRLVLKEVPAASGMVKLEVWVENVPTLKQGTLELTYSPSVLRFSSFVPESGLGMVDFREGTSVKQLLGMFELNSGAPDGKLRLGTLSFEIVSEDAGSAILTLAVRSGSVYNWVGVNGPLQTQPNPVTCNVSLS